MSWYLTSPGLFVQQLVQATTVRTSKPHLQKRKTSQPLRVIIGFPSQSTSNADSVSLLWCHNVLTSACNFDTFRPRQNGCHFPDDIFKCIFMNENVWILIKISLTFVPEGPHYNIPSLVQIMAWRHPGNKQLSEAVMVSLPTHICVTRPQWFNLCNVCNNWDKCKKAYPLNFSSKIVSHMVPYFRYGNIDVCDLLTLLPSSWLQIIICSVTFIYKKNSAEIQWFPFIKIKSQNYYNFA